MYTSARRRNGQQRSAEQANHDAQCLARTGQWALYAKRVRAVAKDGSKRGVACVAVATDPNESNSSELAVTDTGHDGQQS